MLCDVDPSWHEFGLPRVSVGLQLRVKIGRQRRRTTVRIGTGIFDHIAQQPVGSRMGIQVLDNRKGVDEELAIAEPVRANENPRGTHPPGVE